MALHSGPQNTYEEVPDLAKNFIKEAPDERGQRPKSKVSRDTLLKIHQKHLKLLTEGGVPVRNLTLPKPYPPARNSIHATSRKFVRTITLAIHQKGSLTAYKAHLADLLVDSRDQHTVLLLRTIASPYVWSSTVTVVEDATGEVARLTVYNLEDNFIDPIVTEGSIVAVKQPCWTRLVDGGYHIRVDHPSDLEVLKPDDEHVPETWRSEAVVSTDIDANRCKKDGDMMFLKKRFRRALDL